MTLLILLLSYLLPSSVALLRARKAFPRILAVNILLGWTFVGWFAALIWAFAGKRNPDAKARSSAKTNALRGLVALGIVATVCIPVLVGSHRPSTDLAKNTQTGTEKATTGETPGTAPTPKPTATPRPTPTPKPTPTPTPTPPPTPEPTPTPTPFAKRVVKYDLEGQKPDKDDRAAMEIIKKMKWTLNGDPVIAAAEDSEQFLKVAAQMKDYPTFIVKMSVMGTGARSFDQSVEIADKMRAEGATEEEIDKADKLQNPFHAYLATSEKILGENFTNYWTNVLGEMPKANWFDGGITQIGDVVINALNDPKSYQFYKFDVTVAKYAGKPAWKIDYWYRAKNAFGALMLTHHHFYVRNGLIIGVEEPKT